VERASLAKRRRLPKRATLVANILQARHQQQVDEAFALESEIIKLTLVMTIDFG
jgi:hypothetical protein